MCTVDVVHFDFAVLLHFWFEEKRESEEQADEQGAKQRLEGGPGRVDELPRDQVLQGLAGSAKSMP
jgi:hypothetical protein